MRTFYGRDEETDQKGNNNQWKTMFCMKPKAGSVLGEEIFF